MLEGCPVNGLAFLRRPRKDAVYQRGQIDTKDSGLRFSPFRQRGFVHPDHLISNNAGLPVRFEALVNCTHARDCRMVSRGRVELVYLRTVGGLIRTLAIPLIIRALFHEDIRLFRSVSYGNVAPTVHDANDGVAPTTVAAPVLCKGRFIRTFTYDRAQKDNSVPATRGPRVLVTTTLRRHRSVHQVRVMNVDGANNALRSIAASENRVGHSVVIKNLLCRIIIIRRPANAKVSTQDVLLRRSTVLLRLLLRLRRFPLLFKNREIRPITSGIVRRSNVESKGLYKVVCVQTAIRTEGTVSLVVVPNAAARRVGGYLRVVPTRVLNPKETFRRVRRFGYVKDPIGKVTPGRTLLSVSPAYPINDRSLDPGDVKVHDLKNRASATLTGFHRRICREGKAMRNNRKR